MNYRKALISSTIVIACYAAAAHADARADDLDVIRHTVPAASTETADHGQGTYCRIGNTIPGWTCDQELSANGGTGTTGPALSPTPPSKPDCENGPKA